jgi:hypothetical protein
MGQVEPEHEQEGERQPHVQHPGPLHRDNRRRGALGSFASAHTLSPVGIFVAVPGTVLEDARHITFRSADGRY